MIKWLQLIVFLLGIVPLSAQQECAFVLQEAQDQFDAGLIEQIPDKLAACLDRGFTREEKLQAYKLTILSYLYDDNYDMADAAMLEFLKDFPDYDPVATDPNEFVLLMETYDTNPLIMVGGGGGPNFSFPLLLEQFGTHDITAHDGNYAPGGAGFQVSAYAEKVIAKGLSAKSGICFVRNVFDQYLDDESEVIVPSSEITDFSVVDFYETQNRLHIPVALKYGFLQRGNLKPCIEVGLDGGLLLGASGQVQRVYTNSTIAYDPINVTDVNLSDGRRRFNLWLTAGGGFKYSVGPGDFFLNVDYHLNLLNQMGQGNQRYYDHNLVFGGYHVDDDYLLNSISVSAGYMFPFYRPKKKEQ